MPSYRSSSLSKFLSARRRTPCCLPPLRPPDAPHLSALTAPPSGLAALLALLGEPRARHCHSHTYVFGAGRVRHYAPAKTRDVPRTLSPRPTHKSPFPHYVHRPHCRPHRLFPRPTILYCSRSRQNLPTLYYKGKTEREINDFSLPLILKFVSLQYANKQLAQI